MASVYLIFGEDEYQVSTKTREIIAELLPEQERTFGLEVIDASADTIDAAQKALKQCFESLQTIDFFSPKKVIWFRDVSFLSDNVVGRNEEVKDAVNQLSDYIKEEMHDGQVLVVTAPKVHKGKRFYKACSSVGETYEFAVSDKSWQNEKDVADFLGAQAKRLGLKMNSDSVTAFLEKVGTNSRHIVNELEKLQLYLGDRNDVTTADIESITSPSRTSVSWDLMDAFGERNLKKALSVSRQLLFQKESAIGMVAGLNSRVRDLLIYRQALDNNWLSPGRSAKWSALDPEVEEMFESMDKDPRKMHPYRVGILAQQAARFTMRELSRCQAALMDAHHKLVRSSMPHDIILELLLVRMVGR